MHLSEKEYRKQFQNGNKKAFKKQKEALERAWKNRDFEIELYWKRATYFWSFIAAAFAGYFIIVQTEHDYVQAEYIIVCLGFIFSLAWYFANKGSKKWQENWEKHIDMLEDEITGELYKTVLDKSAYSVSKLNMRVNQFVIAVWILLAGNYFIENITFVGTYEDIDYLTIICSLITLIFVVIMWFDKKESERDVSINESGELKFSFSKRNFEYVNPTNNQKQKKSNL